jgi:TolB-like protein/Flp pilus assembly protein TadD
MITVQLLGGASLRSGDVPLSGPPAQRHRIALLTLVVAAWPQPLSRDRAMVMLWPERDTAGARRLLNLAVHVLRGALGDDAISSTGDGLLLNPSRLKCDLHDLRAAIAASETDRVAHLYTGALLDGFHLDDSTDFGYWLDERRTELTHAYVGALLALAERQEESCDFHGWVGTCRRLVASDPHSSKYARGLMRALDAAGDRTSALHHASEHARRLREDLDIEPNRAVVALAEELRKASTRESAPRSSSADVAVSSVAVLPFQNLGAGSENDYFVDGITEDVIAHLSKIRGLKVISRSSVMPFKDRQHSFKEIAGRLGARTVLDGSVRRAGDRVRIVAKLIDVSTDEHLFAETYDRELTDIFAIQTDVALHIAAALKAELSREEQERVRREPTRNLQAYQLFLQGKQWFRRYTAGAMDRAIDFFGRAIAQDPTFALAHASLAMAYTEQGEWGVMPPEIAYERAKEAVETALKLDPDLGAAHCTIAHLKGVHDLDWTGAEKEFKRALELTPSNSDAYNLYGRLCAALGRFDDAFALQQRAKELDPLAHRMDSITTLLRAGRYDEALAAAETQLDLDPNYDRALATLGWAYLLSGRNDEGVQLLERAVSVSPGNTFWLGQLGQAYAMNGREQNAREILRGFEERRKSAYVSAYHFAYVYVGLGELDQALDYLETALTERTGPAYSMKGSFLLKPLHDHPRFRALLRRMNLE